MREFYMKALWVALPALAGVGVTMLAGTRLDVQVIAYGVLALVAAFGVWATSARARRIERDEDERAWRAALMERLDRGEEVDRAMLRTELVRAHREWAEDKGYVTLEALEVLGKTHEAYNAVGGNDTGDRLWEDIRALPIEEKR